jgi:hypothetical protein
MMIIKSMLGLISPSNSVLSVLIARINMAISFFIDISFFHVLRSLNSIVDSWANRALALSLGDILKNGVLRGSQIPQCIAWMSTNINRY